MNKYEAVAEKLRELSEDDVVNLWNTMVKGEDDGYRHIWENDEDSLNECYEGCSIKEILGSTFGGSYNAEDYYFKYDMHGTLTSFTDLEDSDSPLDMEELATWFCDVFEMTAEYLSDSDLEEDFYDYLIYDCGTEVPSDYNIEKAKADIFEEYGVDFITDDWDDYVQVISDKYETD